MADRIFDVFDSKKEGYLEFSQFTAIMDVLCNGTDDEKNQFSFALMDENGNGSLSFQEFYEYISQVISHWSSLINSHVRINRSDVQQIFRKIDIDDDKVIRYSEYRRALRKNPELLDWFDILNSAKGSGGIHEETGAATKVQADTAQEEQNVVRIEKEKVERIVNLKNANEKKSNAVKKLKHKVTKMQGQTEEQLQQIMR